MTHHCTHDRDVPDVALCRYFLTQRVAVAAFGIPPSDRVALLHFPQYPRKTVHSPLPGTYFPVVVNAVHSRGGH